jgi:hypothetical protein
MAKTDEITFEVLDDGTIRVTTPNLSGPNHKSADELLLMVERLAGGEPNRQKNKQAHTHTQQKQILKH